MKNRALVPENTFCCLYLVMYEGGKEVMYEREALIARPREATPPAYVSIRQHTSAYEMRERRSQVDHAKLPLLHLVC
jgi:hypothetical protein